MSIKLPTMHNTIRIIGIDPGLRRTGWGVIDTLGNSLRFVASGTVTSDGDMDLASRLCQLHDGLVDVIHTHKPDEAAVEQTFVNKDAVATLKLWPLHDAWPLQALSAVLQSLWPLQTLRPAQCTRATVPAWVLACAWPMLPAMPAAMTASAMPEKRVMFCDSM